jgi:hypothetical protein
MSLETTAHKYVAHLARELAETQWEELCRDNAFYHRNKAPENKAAFLAMFIPDYRKVARSILAQMLARNDVSEADKEEIWEALTLDRTLPKGGTSYRPN